MHLKLWGTILFQNCTVLYEGSHGGRLRINFDRLEIFINVHLDKAHEHFLHLSLQNCNRCDWKSILQHRTEQQNATATEPQRQVISAITLHDNIIF